MNLSGQKVVVLGLGRTGIATVRFLAAREAQVLAVDDKPRSELAEEIRLLDGVTAEFNLGGANPDALSDVDLVVPSPGVPPFNNFLRRAVEEGIPVISEVELAYRFLRKPMISITGTNGKTTTTQLVGHILRRWGKKVFIGGNIGNPLIGYINGPQDDDFLVIEVSSFQLQWIDVFRPFVSILLNVSPDHLDYHATFDEYRRVKERIFENQDAGDCAILNADDPLSDTLAARIRSDVRFFSSSAQVDSGICREDAALRYHDTGRVEHYPIDGITLKGSHNLENIMAAILAARWCGCPPGTIMEAVKTFAGLPHRLEFVAAKDGVEFYNDSKGTNVDAVARALESFTQPVILLLGGRNKGGGFTELSLPIRERVSELVVFGEARGEINRDVGHIVPTRSAENLADAVDIARRDSQPGNVILLSPGCASFDEFTNYEERGDFFRSLVQQL